MLAGSLTPAKRQENLAELEKRGFRTSGHQPFSGPILGGPVPMAKEQLTDNPTAHCDNAATPQCIAILYNITKATKAQAGNQLGIFEEGKLPTYP
jgi:tripeptidyl-peptidase-1